MRVTTLSRYRLACRTSWRISFSAPSKASLIKGRFGGIVYMVADFSAKRTKKRIALCYPSCVERKMRLEPTMLVGNSRKPYLYPQPLEGVSGVASGEGCFNAKRKKTAKSCLLHFERKTRLELAPLSNCISVFY